MPGGSPVCDFVVFLGTEPACLGLDNKSPASAFAGPQLSPECFKHSQVLQSSVSKKTRKMMHLSLDIRLCRTYPTRIVRASRLVCDQCNLTPLSLSFTSLVNSENSPICLDCGPGGGIPELDLHPTGLPSSLQTHLLTLLSTNWIASPASAPLDNTGQLGGRNLAATALAQTALEDCKQSKLLISTQFCSQVIQRKCQWFVTHTKKPVSIDVVQLSTITSTQAVTASTIIWIE